MTLFGVELIAGVSLICAIVLYVLVHTYENGSIREERQNTSINCLGKCEQGYVCSHGICQIPDGNKCSSSAVCGAGDQCISGVCTTANCASGQIFWIKDCWPLISGIDAFKNYTQNSTAFSLNPASSSPPTENSYGNATAIIINDLLEYNEIASSISVNQGSMIVSLDDKGLVYYDPSVKMYIHIDTNGIVTNDVTLSFGGYSFKGETVSSGYIGSITLGPSDKRYLLGNCLTFSYSGLTVIIDSNTQAHIIQFNVDNYILRNETAVVSFQ